MGMGHEVSREPENETDIPLSVEQATNYCKQLQTHLNEMLSAVEGPARHELNDYNDEQPLADCPESLLGPGGHAEDQLRSVSSVNTREIYEFSAAQFRKEDFEASVHFCESIALFYKSNHDPCKRMRAALGSHGIIPIGQDRKNSFMLLLALECGRRSLLRP